MQLSIFNVTPSGLERGDLSRLFHKGQAVILNGDERIFRLFRSVLDWLGLNHRDADDESPFEMNLLDLARNHQEGDMQAGDMLRFVPSSFGHLARKFVVCPSAVDQSLEAFPNAFYLGNRRVPVPNNLLKWSWNLMSEVFRSALPKHANTLPYAVEVDVLIYPTSGAEIYKLHTLLADSGGFWSQLGHRIDANKANAAGTFDMKVIRDLFAVTCLIPGIKHVAEMLNNRMFVSSEKSVPEDYQIIGDPHVDSSKYITGLVGCRDNLRTHILCAKRWIPLPVTAHTLTVFPAGKITSFEDIPTTRHRVLLRNPPNESTAKRNITLSLSIVDRPKNSALNSRL